MEFFLRDPCGDAQSDNQNMHQMVREKDF